MIMIRIGFRDWAEHMMNDIVTETTTSTNNLEQEIDIMRRQIARLVYDRIIYQAKLTTK